MSYSNQHIWDISVTYALSRSSHFIPGFNWFHHWINISICAREFYFKPENKPDICLDITYHISYIHHISILYPSHIHHISIMYPSHIHHIPIIYPSYIHHYPSSSIIIHHYPSLSIHLCMISDWTSGSQFMIKRKKNIPPFWTSPTFQDRRIPWRL